MEDKEDKKEKQRREVHSQRVKAGKRTYFFDIKPTRSNDYYLTITESKKRFKEEGFYYEKHKIFLYKEDFQKFYDAFQKAYEYMQNELLPDYDFEGNSANGDQEEKQENYSSLGSNESSDDELKWD